MIRLEQIDPTAHIRRVQKSRASGRCHRGSYGPFPDDQVHDRVGEEVFKDATKIFMSKRMKSSGATKEEDGAHEGKNQKSELEI